MNDLINYITRKLDGRDVVVILFIDMKKAFDTVNKDRLLNKLDSMGISGKALTMIETYIKNRPQKN